MAIMQTREYIIGLILGQDRWTVCIQKNQPNLYKTFLCELRTSVPGEVYSYSMIQIKEYRMHTIDGQTDVLYVYHST